MVQVFLSITRCCYAQIPALINDDTDPRFIAWIGIGARGVTHDALPGQTRRPSASFFDQSMVDQGVVKFMVICGREKCLDGSKYLLTERI